MRFCNSGPIPHSAFLKWGDDDRAKALAFMLEDSLICQMCGTAHWEWDPDQGGSRFAYEATIEQCPGCYVKESSSVQVDKRPGVTVQLSSTRTPEARERRRRQAELRRRDREERLLNRERAKEGVVQD